jgi:DNA-directed RNA polymerase specialized sigma24 family protein
LKRDWDLTKEAFDTLLGALNPNRDRAAAIYESIRKKLITFFECRHCSSPEDYADITINRVARRISEGKIIYTADPSSFFFGVAYKVLQEYWGERARRGTSLSDLPLLELPSENPIEAKEKEAERIGIENHLECLEQCIQSLTAKNRRLIIQYYEGETRARIRNRKGLAEEFGIPLNALRIRALRIRERLEECVGECMKSRAGS